MLVSALLAGLLSTQAPAGETTAYTIDIQDTGSEIVDVRIGVRFRGDEDGVTSLHLPSDWGGETELWRNLDALTVFGGDARIEPGETPDERVIRHAPGATLTASYRVLPDRPGAPQAVAGDYYRPVVTRDIVHLIGLTYLVIPDTITEQVSVELDAPDGWTLASDLEHAGLTSQALAESILVAGDFRLETRSVNGADLRIAIHGTHSASDEVFGEMAEAVLRANQAYWDDTGEPYLITVLPLGAEPGMSSVGGTNLADSFAFFATDNAESAILERILMHEHVHTWNPNRLGGLVDGPAQPGEYWFSEGFTDFLTQRAAVRGAVWPAATALQSWNEALMENAQSAVRDAPNTAIETGFWTDPDFQRLPYHRGMIFAALVDARIREATGGVMDLDNVLHAMADEESETTAAERFADTVLRVTGLDISDLVQRHIVEGVPVSLPTSGFGACGPVETFEQPVFEYGMTGGFDEDGEFIIQSVDPDGPAAPAGFLPGMRIVERLEGAVGDASVDSVLRVELDGEVQDLRYRPTNGEILTVQQIVPGSEAESAACAGLLGGD